MTSSNWNIFRVTGLLGGPVGNSPVTGEFPLQRPVTRSFDVFANLSLNKRLSKQSWCWWFETPWPPLWLQSNGPVIQVSYLPVAEVLNFKTFVQFNNVLHNAWVGWVLSNPCKYHFCNSCGNLVLIKWSNSKLLPLFQFFLTFVPNDPNDIESVLVQMMSCRYVIWINDGIVWCCKYFFRCPNGLSEHQQHNNVLDSCEPFYA